MEHVSNASQAEHLKAMTHTSKCDGGGKAARHQDTGPTMHQRQFSTLDSDRHTWLPMRRRQGCKPADPDTAGEPRTEQRRQSK
ncbi:hypothetical protein ABVT39_008325, partial [Epinephelus coioides]